VFTIEQIKDILVEAKKLGTVDSISMEGGEPFLFYPIMVRAVEEAVKLGFRVEVLSNCYWASCPEDAKVWLLPMAKDVELSLSSDFYHGESWQIEEVKIFRIGAKRTCADYSQLVYILPISITIMVATDFFKSDVLSKTRKIFMVKWYAKSDRESTENWPGGHFKHRDRSQLPGRNTAIAVGLAGDLYRPQFAGCGFWNFEKHCSFQCGHGQRPTRDGFVEDIGTGNLAVELQLGLRQAAQHFQ